MVRRNVFFLAVLLFSGAAGAQDAPALRYQVTTWEPSSGVSGTTQTPDGFVWVATKTGLQRFDGLKFAIFNRTSRPALPADEVRRVLVTRDGSLWVGMTRAGLVRMQAGKVEVFNQASGLVGDEISGLLEDPAGDLWVGTRSGVSRLRSGVWRSYTRADGLLDDDVIKMFIHHDGRLRIETGLGLSHFEGDALVSVPLPVGGSPERVRFMLPQYAPPGTPQIDPDILVGRPYLVSGSVRDRAGRVWIGTRGGLVQVGHSGDILQIFGAKDGLTGDGINSMFEDRDGNMWVATVGGGLSRLSRPRMLTLTRVDGLGGDVPQGLSESPDGGVWVTTTEGLSLWRHGKFTNFSPGVDSMLSHSLRSTAAAPDGNVWITVMRGPLARFRDGQFQQFGKEEGFPAGAPTALLATRTGVVFVGSELGEFGSIEKDRFVPFTPNPFLCPKGSCPNRINVLIERRAGGVWMTTSGAGVLRFDGQSITPLHTNPPLPRSGLEGLLEDGDGTLWVGSRSGLYRVRGDQAFRFGVAQGLPDENVSGVVDDGIGYLWLGCARGLARVRTKDLADVADGKQTQLRGILYDHQDGVKGDEVAQGSHPLGLRLRDGRLMYATVRGVVLIEAPARWDKWQPPQAIVDRVAINGVDRQISAGTAFDVSPGEGALEIHYTAPTPNAAHRVGFRYKLEGFDTAWVNAGPRRAAYYTNLPPGRYTFRLVAYRDDDEVSAPVEASVNFQLQPHFRQTWLFYGLLGLLVVLLGASVQWLRVGQVEARFAAVLAERNRIARDLHDALAQVFSALGFQLDRLLGSVGSSNPEASERIHQARQMVAHGRLAAGTIVTNLRASDRARVPLHQALEELPKIYDTATFMVAVQGTVRPLPPAVENELLRIAEEAVSNAIAHGRAQRISIELTFEGERVELWVRDDGAGFTPEGEPASGHQPGGFGLLGMRERAGRIGGRLQIESEAGVGTEVGVVIESVPRVSEPKRDRS